MSIEYIVDLSHWLQYGKLGTFIGFKGRHIKSIEKKYKVVLNVEKNFELKITGIRKAVDLALVDVELHALNIFGTSGTHTFSIPTERIGYLIGRNGQKISAIKNDSGAKINVNRESKGNLTEITVSGEFPVILSATGMIKDRLDSFGQDLTPYNRVDRKEFYECWDEVIYED